MDLELLVSLDDFATPGAVVSAFNYYGRASGARPQPDPLLSEPYYYMSFDLPGHPNSTTSPGDPIPTLDLKKIAQLQGIPEGTKVTFRLYAWGNETTGASHTLALGRMAGPKIEGVVTGK
jgi:hypothetical protein